MTKLTDEEFMIAYRVTSTRGRLYSRGMLLAATTRTVIARACKVPRQAIGVVLDDPAFMRPLAGMVPARVADEAVLEAIRRGALGALT
jgi:hypothetical protein